MHLAHLRSSLFTTPLGYKAMYKRLLPEGMIVLQTRKWTKRSRGQGRVICISLSFIWCLLLYIFRISNLMEIEQNTQAPWLWSVNETHNIRFGWPRSFDIIYIPAPHLKRLHPFKEIALILKPMYHRPAWRSIGRIRSLTPNRYKATPQISINMKEGLRCRTGVFSSIVAVGFHAQEIGGCTNVTSCLANAIQSGFLWATCVRSRLIIFDFGSWHFQM